MIEIKIADMNEFKSGKQGWNDLVHQMRRPSIFCTWEWINSWLEFYGNSYEPFILYIFIKNKMIGILPLAKRIMRMEDHLFPVRVLTYCGSQELHSDHIDLLCLEEHTELCIIEIKKYFARSYRNWDLIELSHVAEDSRMMLMRNGMKIGHHVNSSKVSCSPYITLKGNFEEYCGKMRGDRRRELRRTIRVLYGRENVSYMSYEPEGPYGINDLFDLHKLRISRKGENSSFSGEVLLDFHKKIIKDFYQKGWLRMGFLCHNNKPVAAIYGYDYCGRHFGYQMGMDPAWERRSVGSVLLYEMIEKSYDKQLLEFDFLRGGEHYKGKWTDESRDLYNISIYNNNFMGMSARLYLQLRTSLKTALMKKLDRAGKERGGNGRKEADS